MEQLFTVIFVLLLGYYVYSKVKKIHAAASGHRRPRAPGGEDKQDASDESGQLLEAEETDALYEESLQKTDGQDS